MKSSKGFIKTIIIIVVALIILSFLGYNIDSVINAPAIKNFFVSLLNLVFYIFGLVVDIIVLIFHKVFSLFS